MGDELGPKGKRPGRRRPPRRARRADGVDLERLVAVVRKGRLRRRPIRRRRAWLASTTLVVAAVVAGSLAAVAFTGRTLLLDSCSLSDLQPIALGENSFVFSGDGSLLGVVPSKKNRQPVSLAEMSPWLPKATVAIEDRRFYEHGALDYQGIARAFVADLEAGRIVEGGSTITQELARNLYIGHPQRTFARKLREACLAEKLAGRMTKRQILDAYLNEVFYGHHAYGAQAGAETYFSTKAKGLTLPQAALLAGLPQAPSTYDPFRHPQLALVRRNDVLRALHASGELTRAQFAKALRAPLGLHPGRLYSSLHQPNFFGWATQQLVARFGERRVQAGGLRVKTTLDPRLQHLAEQAAKDVLHTPTDPAAAVVAIDPTTGAVRAMVGYVPGGRTLQFNLVTQAHRTTGSAFKPITLATAFSEGVSPYSTFYGPPQLAITDPQCATNGGPWNVHNYADEAAGTMNLFDATAYSVNTIFAQLIAKVGVHRVVRMAHRLGVTTNIGAFCSDTLGSQAITPLELTDVYATLADRGVHHAPQAFQSVRSASGTTIGPLHRRGQRVLGANAADLVTYALRGVVEHGTGTAAALGSRPVAGKTGTAEHYQDAWFCGFVPQLATCVWVGYPKGEIPLYGIEGFSKVFGGSLPAEIWHEFMSGALAGLPVLDFHAPSSFGGTYISGSGTYYSYTPPVTTRTATTAAQSGKRRHKKP